MEFAEIVGLPAARAVRSDAEEFPGEGDGGAVVHLAARGESLDGGGGVIYGGGVNGAPASENGVVFFVRGNEVELSVFNDWAIVEESVGQKG